MMSVIFFLQEEGAKEGAPWRGVKRVLLPFFDLRNDLFGQGAVFNGLRVQSLAFASLREKRGVGKRGGSGGWRII